MEKSAEAQRNLGSIVHWKNVFVFFSVSKDAIINLQYLGQEEEPNSSNYFLIYQLKYVIYVLRTNFKGAVSLYFLFFMLWAEMIFQSGSIKHLEFLNLQKPA